ncbi:MAG TPA: hypothetical protein VKD25_09095 [Burkholderiales bacterium]|nr:hypothetical protein [Burkholderiales bacterium]
MENRAEARGAGWLAAALLVYACASLLHFSHNAAFLQDYPDMPAWLTPARVMAVWAGQTAVGLTGYLVFRRGYRWAGLAMVAVYGVLGLDSLVHYGLAPVSAHTLAMNLTIWLEAAAAVVVLVAVARLLMMEAGWQR